MRVVGIQSIQSGVGATSVAAALAVALNDSGVRTFAMDLTPENTLGLMFGMPLDDTNGLLMWDLTNTHIRDLIFESDQGYPFIPMGRVFGVEQQNTASKLDLISEQLDEWLEPLREIEERILIVDTPRTANSLQAWVYRSADIVINVVEPEPRLMSSLLEFEAVSLARQAAAEVASFVLVNGIAPHLALNQDLTDFLKASLSEDVLVPLMIHRDQHIPEAFASMTPLASYAPSAQSTRDFSTLSLWLLRQLADVKG